MLKDFKISVGIMAEEQLRVSFLDVYSCDNREFTGTWDARVAKGQIVFTNGTEEYNAQSFFFSAEDGSFSVEDVTIGVNFHWEAKEVQSFQGNLKLIVEGEKVRLINELSIEDYLCSVISSEMSAMSSIELLKAHTIISRSWLIAQIEKSQKEKTYNSYVEDDEERIRWYDREDHDTFHVCADDHCQRYQGLTRQLSPLVKQAVDATRGVVLKYDGEICDTRYYKCCGGMTEEFDTCWEPESYHYLKGIVDNDSMPLGLNIDLRNEENAKAWIMSNPEAFCNVTDRAVLSQVLNDFDQSTLDFYRWKVEYSQSELSELIKQRSGIDFGEIKELISLERGSSGRIYKLKIVGTKRTFTLGKELEIRKILSTSHLYSSAFVVEYGESVDDIPQKIALYGAGWGHGVGLCQIGAAVMAEKGYNYKQILAHYFRGADLQL